MVELAPGLLKEDDDDGDDDDSLPDDCISETGDDFDSVEETALA